MSISVTNQIEQVGYKGQSVRIYLDQTDSAQLPNINVGDSVTGIPGATTEGYVYSVDLYGNSFLISPYAPNEKFGLVTTGSPMSIG